MERQKRRANNIKYPQVEMIDAANRNGKISSKPNSVKSYNQGKADIDR